MSTRCKPGLITNRSAVLLTVAIMVIGVAIAGSVSLADDEKAEPAPVEPQSTISTHVSAVPDECHKCHTCAQPSTENPCLHPCPRPHDTAARTLAEQPQGIILLDMLSDTKDEKDHFGPVPFDHSGHADWAEIAGGCTVCHHNTPESNAHPACNSCHEIAYKHEDLSKPGLKGAYHRQCMGCHREWSHDTKCGVCHLPRVGEDGAKSANTITRDDVVGAMHPPIQAPDIKLYQTDQPPDVGSSVYFHHERHTEGYDLACAECHRGDSCARCHEADRQPVVQQKRTTEEQHAACSICHDTDDEEQCSDCHRGKGAPIPEAFQHESTGWPLSKYHRERSCRVCHKPIRFVKLDRECDACHGDWDGETFNHAVTGQILDENHLEADCADCHADRKFNLSPRCDECHDEEEGISFPTKRPGPLVGKEQKTATNTPAEKATP